MSKKLGYVVSYDEGRDVGFIRSAETDEPAAAGVASKSMYELSREADDQVLMFKLDDVEDGVPLIQGVRVQYEPTDPADQRTSRVWQKATKVSLATDTEASEAEQSAEGGADAPDWTDWVSGPGGEDAEAW